ncbi:hypothetical protein ACHAXA_011348 [Cyclostephanos tholiformis]|uniref:Uncharacterized protein n=1 Tax=Cyclostephanos tholiformis TaxID=382380 RepID=A0ABD3R7N9_9STRA
MNSSPPANPFVVRDDIDIVVNGGKGHVLDSAREKEDDDDDDDDYDYEGGGGTGGTGGGGVNRPRRIRRHRGIGGNVDHPFEMIPTTEEYDECHDYRDDDGMTCVEIGGGDDGDGDDYRDSGTILPEFVYHYLYPPNVPRSCQLYRIENIAIPSCYLLVGILQGLSGPFANVYPLDLGASEAQQSTISSLKSLPASFKLIFGFVSDNLPLCGYRRKSYMLLGWGMTSISMFALLAFSDLSSDAASSSSFAASAASSTRQLGGDMMRRYANDEGGGGITTTITMDDGVYRTLDVRGDIDQSSYDGVGPPSIPLLSICLLLFGTGFWFADVMGDSLVAERAKLEPTSSRGQLQSSCYACRFFGLMISAPVGTLIYGSSSIYLGPRGLVLLMATLPACIVPLVLMLGETRNANVPSTKDQCREIWNTVCSRAVWQPMGFVYLYNVLQVGNAAWKQFLKTVLGFTSNQLNSLLIVAYVLLWLGIMAYKKFFIHWSWRTVYVLTTSLNGLLSSLQVLLIKGMTFGLSPYLFALGDDAFADFIAGIQFLPTTIMMVHLCPSGSEGASYAMFTTVNNSAGNLAGAVSTLLLGVWDVSKGAMELGNLVGMINLTWLTTAMQMSGLLFVGLLPRTKEDLAKLHVDPMSGSKIGGFVFLFVTFSSVLYSLIVGVLNIVKPGWAGES